MRNDQIAKALGRIEAEMKCMNKSVDGMSAKIDQIDERLRSVEIKSGVISLTVSSVVAALAASLGYPPAS